MLRCLAVVWVCFCAVGVAAAAEDLEFRAPAAADGAATASAMRSLAVRALPVYENPSREQFLTNLSALQMVAGEYAAAYATRQSLRELRQHQRTAREVDESLIYDLYAQARAQAVKGRMPFDQAFAGVFHEAVSPLDDLDAYTVTEWLATPLSVFRGNLQRELDRLRGKERISLSEAVDLTWTYLSFEAFQSFGPLIGPLVAEDDRARYLIDDDVPIKTPDKATLSALVVRPKGASSPLPTLLEFTMSADPHNDARECAAHGYAGVVAYVRTASGGGETRAASGSAGALAAYEHEGDDARAAIDWIAAQRWSDGRVGMYGSGYSAFAAWAAAKRPPPALKALAASSAVAPGIDAPGPESLEDMPEALYRRSQQHRSFDRYWRKSMPYQKDFAHIDFPVLTTTGYFDPDETGSLYYFTEHYRYDARASQTLLIGPYDSHAMQRGPLPVLAGYAVDEAAVVDLHELRYRWFDHVLKGAPSPDLLAERVNFEVMGANAWRHVGSLEAMANGAVRLYLDAARLGSRYRLSGHEPSRKRFVEEPIESAGQDAASGVITGVVVRTLPLGGAVFVSGPLHRPLQVSGRISGQLAFAASRGGLALGLRLYELRPSGEYFQIFAPPEALCAGCAPGRATPRLSGPRAGSAPRAGSDPRIGSDPGAGTAPRTGSDPGVGSEAGPDSATGPGSRPARLARSAREQRLEFRSDRLTSVELQTGSRIVLVLDARAQADGAQADARKKGSAAARHSGRGARSAKAAPPEVRWYGGSFIELPVWR